MVLAWFDRSSGSAPGRARFACRGRCSGAVLGSCLSEPQGLRRMATRSGSRAAAKVGGRSSASRAEQALQRSHPQRLPGFLERRAVRGVGEGVEPGRQRGLQRKPAYSLARSRRPCSVVACRGGSRRRRYPPGGSPGGSGRWPASGPRGRTVARSACRATGPPSRRSAQRAVSDGRKRPVTTDRMCRIVPTPRPCMRRHAAPW